MILSTSDSISVTNLEKKFGAFVAVNKITFSVKKGEIFGFLGANGSGKSTTIRMLCGIITPTSGGGIRCRARHYDGCGRNKTFHRLYVAKIFSL